MKDSGIIQLKFMRKLDYKYPYMHDKISYSKIKDAIEFLLQTNLFKEKKIQFSFSWKNNEKTGETNFIVDTDDESTSGSKVNKNLSNKNNQTQFSRKLVSDKSEVLSSSETEEDYFANNNIVYKNQATLLHNEIICAPGEGNFPKSILFDDAAEELTFLKIYGGQRATYPDDLSYAAICKSEFRRYDRRCALDFTKLFYSYKKLVASKLVDSINTCLQKTNKTQNLTAQEALSKEKMDSFFTSNEAHLFLRTIRSSPQFWEWKKSEINAMIRQLGCPTFFLTFSPAEVDWIELMVILYNVLKNKKISYQQAENIDRKKRIEILAKDPVTVARYFENRIMELIKYNNSPVGPFREHFVNDYFWRSDFQERGSPHVHMLVWLENAPKYLSQKELNKEDYELNTLKCCDFIDKYITCAMPLDLEYVDDNSESTNKDFTVFNIEVNDEKDDDENDYEEDEWSTVSESSCDIATSSEINKETTNAHKASIKYQKHAHKTNCTIVDKYGNEICKYGFPWPIMNSTIILEPFDKDVSQFEKDDAYDDFIRIRVKLTSVVNRFKLAKIQISLDELLSDLNISFDQYKHAFRASISKPTVFLKRNCQELMLNSYNKSIFVRHRANMDIQFVTDPYGAATYVAAYMLKSNAAMSTLLQKARKEMDNGKEKT